MECLHHPAPFTEITLPTLKPRAKRGAGSPFVDANAFKTLGLHPFFAPEVKGFGARIKAALLYLSKKTGLGLLRGQSQSVGLTGFEPATP